MFKFPRIRGIGVEVEGLWTENRRRVISQSIHRDGSVQFDGQSDNEDDDDEENGPSQRDRVGEISSPVLREWEEVEEFIRLNYPSRTNKTCGLHMHVSTYDVGRYQALMNRQFFDLVYRRAATFAVKICLLYTSDAADE